MPSTERSCTGWCLGRWMAGNWSECHLPCQNGRRFRQVNCMIQGRKVNALNCPRASMPNYLQDCSHQCVHWVYSDWGQCSASCGSEGRQTRLAICKNAKNWLIDSSLCVQWIGLATDTTRPCFSGLESLPPCPGSEAATAKRYNWRVTEWSSCSKSCGNGGVRHRSVDCAVLNGSNETVVADEKCQSAGQKPVETQACNGQINCPYWVFHNWSKCSTSCEGDSSHRAHFACVWRVTALASVLTPSDFCPPLPSPMSAMVCSSEPVDRAHCSASWRASNWSECLTECDQGIQLRTVQCQLDGRIVEEHQCNRTARPIDLRLCNSSVQCPGEWITEKWSECSQSCGSSPGVRLRTVACHNSAGQPTSESACQARQRPAGMMECGQVPCPTWHPADWTSCIGLCDKGSRSRDVQCRWSNGSLATSDTQCSPELRPHTSESCQLEGPACQWRVGPWSRCQLPASALCHGERRGHRHRSVECRLGEAGPLLPEVLCLEQRLRRPRSRRRCRAWVVGTAKNASDGPAACGSARKLPANESDSGGLEQGRQAYRIGAWSACSATCGRGFQTRRLTPCDAAQPHGPTACRPTRRRPRSRRRCFVAFCPHAWTADPWSACSTSCGPGWITRRVQCQRFTPEGWRDGPAADAASACDAQQKPESRRACSLGDCLKIKADDDGSSGSSSGGDSSGPFWEAGDFSECRYSNGECGEGERRRVVLCALPTAQLDKGGEDFNGRRCNRDQMPPEKDACEAKRCHPSSCSELKRTLRVKLDGQYRLRIGGRDVRVYCFGMGSRNPREFITLPASAPGDGADRAAGPNFAVMHNIGLANPTPPSACPSPTVLAGFSRAACSKPGADCLVVPDRPGSFVSGMTAYKKYRLLLSPRLEVDATDDTFAISWKSFVPAGRAGDCFSSLAGCSVGSFSIDLSGTDFALDRNGNSWLSLNATTVIVNYVDQQRVQGICGGLCGLCKLRNDRLLLSTALNSNFDRL